MKEKLLIIGAGGHGKVVAEIAEDCGYNDIIFIDDNSEVAVGRIEELEKFKEEFPNAIVSIGNNKLRESLILHLEKLEFNIPTLVHPSSYVSRSCLIRNGTVIEPKAIVNANSIIGKGCIISVGSVVDHDVIIGNCCHINSGSIVKAGAKVNDYVKLEAGEVVLGYETARVKK